MAEPIIGIYRMTRYPDHDKIIFQGNDDAVNLFRKTFPLRVDTAKKGYEGGYQTWLRDEAREGLYGHVKRFFRQHYRPPEVKVGMFIGSKPLSNTWSNRTWIGKVTDSIKAAFTDFVIEDDMDGWTEIYIREPIFSQKGVSIYRGIRFRIEINDELYPVLFCDVKHKFHLNDQPAGMQDISRRLGNSESLMTQIRSKTTRSSDSHFSTYQWFVQKIGILSGCDDMEFRVEPFTARELKYETWFWLHDTDTQIEIANNIHTNLSQVLLSDGGGFYQQPNDIQILLLLPDESSSPVVPKGNWLHIREIVDDYIYHALPQVDKPFAVVHYSLDPNQNAFADEIKAFVDKYPGRRLLTLMFGSEKSTHTSRTEAEAIVEQRSWSVQKAVRDFARGGYVITIGWDSILHSLELPYHVNNAVTRGLYQMGARPWRLVSPPIENSNPDEVIFIGLAHDMEFEQLAGVAFNADGTIIGYSGNHVASTIEYGALVGQVVGELFSLRRTHLSLPLRQVIVHVPVTIERYAKQLATVLKKEGITCNAVSIAPNSGPHLFQNGNKHGTPSLGIAIGNEQIAYLVNTYSIPEKSSTDEGILPAPNIVTVKRLAGEIPMRLLAAQVFWFTAIHINAIHRTVDTPMTLDFADRLCQHIGKGKNKKDMRPTLADDKVMFWL